MPVVIVAPGQGSQSPGFLAPWLDEPRYSDHLGALSDAAGVDLHTHGTVSDADTIRDTAVAQPLIVAASILTLAAVTAGGRLARVHGVAGHSVGEIAAAVAAGILTEDDGMRLVALRGRAMADAAASPPETGMSAVIGGDEAELLGRLDELGLTPANFNGGGQLVAAGPLDALAELRSSAPAGARVIPLQVAGAFHTRVMEPAVATLGGLAATLSPADPERTIWSNRDGEPEPSGTRFLESLVAQVANPVRWDRTMDSMVAAGVTGVIELAPAGALTGLAKRGMPGVPTVAVKTPADLAAAHELLDAAA